MKSLGLVAVGIGLALASGSSVVTASLAATTPATAPAKAAPAKAPAAKAPAAKRVAPRPNAPPLVVEPAALAALRSMSAYLATLPVAELTSNSSMDVVTNQGQRVQMDAMVRYRIRRSDGFVIDYDSEGKKRTYFYDGKNFTVFAPKLGYYATAPAPPTIRQTLDAIEDRFGISLPLEDLFRWNDTADDPARNLTSAYLVGTATIDGVTTDHYAMRQAKVDWEIWIQKGDQPLPLKVVIVDQVDPAHPAYIARLSWNTSPTFKPADFTFQPGPEAMLIRMSELAR